MYLSKLEIIGFKSFAQKVNLTFDSGISAIVGPNGCGKTNIVDAIRWVLGEQRYSALRSEKMEDVIFNGTKARKPLGMAEASLLIENTKGILPSEYTQVTIGRRVYRSGESEYLLNKVPCRLKDILDLFMDTGMGADAYSVIELKMVETILSDKTDERRRLFEEAAGVTKYKHRRKAAYRKLESVQADLVRVNDIVTEVQKAVNSLERQAKKAEQFNEVKARLRTLEIDLMEREYAQLVGRTVPLEERLAGLLEDKNRIDTDLSQEETTLDELRNNMSDVERRLAEAQRDAATHSEQINRVEQKNLVAAERIKALQDNVIRFKSEKDELHAEMGQLGQLKDTLTTRIVELRTEEERVAQDLAHRQSALRDLELRLDAKKSELQGLNDRTIALVHAIAEKQTAQDRKKGRIENLNGRAAHGSEEIAAYQHEIGRIDGDIEALSNEDKRLRRAFTEAEMQYYEAEAKKRDLREKLDQVQVNEVELRGEIDRKTATADFLKGLIETREGLSEGVRFLSSTDRWKPSRNLTVADAIYADEKYRTAIETAVGEYAGLIIVDSVKDAEAGIALLKSEERGKVTFVCLERMPEIVSRMPLPKMPGVIGWAADLSKYERAFAPLFRFILNRILVVDTDATAAKVIQATSGVRCVTLAGELGTGVGITRGGSRRNDEGGMIGKQAQIEDIHRSISTLQEELAALRTTKEQILSDHDVIDLKSLAEVVKGIEKEMNGVEMRIAQLEFEKKRAGDIIARNQEEIAGISAETAALTEEITAEAPELERFSLEKTDVEHSVGAVSAELASIESEWGERSKEVNDCRIQSVTVKGEHENALNDLRRAEEAITDIITTLERRDVDIRRGQEDIAFANASVEENARVVVMLGETMAQLEERKTAVEQEATHVREEMHRIELKIKDERRSHDDSMQAVHDLDVKITELKGKTEHILARAQEEYELALVLKSYAEGEFVDFAALRDEIQGLRDKLKTLGNINFAAFEEYTTEKQRYEFLSSQRTDLLEAEKTLLATIEEINSTAQRKFLDTFALIRTNFIETFKSLFDPGDECDLKLEEGVDPLEAGIDIVAKPRGKRPTSIHLLSGGEKTLTATALLFAIYLVKPSPFCILDEVDAPLDDPNVDRFTRILRKFSNNTQFIVVTHNKRTMEAANALYGVTMEEEGVSKLVTVRFNQSAQVHSASLVSG
ncbi:MAG TPA: chromosome segregation protein SMC [Bacteroidota bacterium]|nr:chromosome segregation protein SMC [Bacteroidota bacterium]